MTVGVVMLIIGVLLFFIIGIRIVRPTERALIERLGKYKATVDAGFNWIIPIVDRLIKVNITEQMIDVPSQTVITKDKLNADVDAIVYYQVKDVKASIYNVDNHAHQLSSLARTTLRAVIGKMTLTEANENRDEINGSVEKVLIKETTSYGVEVLRVEIQTIDPPQDVQNSMNEVVKAEQVKIASKDLANAKEIEADGFKRAAVKKAEGMKQAAILEAQGEANAIIAVAEAKAKQIETVNKSINAFFKDKAVVYKQLETAENSLKNNSKIIVDSKSDLVNVISESVGVVPIKEKTTKTKSK